MNDTIRGLLDALTHDNWFDMMPVLADAYREFDYEMGDACQWLIDNRKRPHPCPSEKRRGRYIWQRIDEENWNEPAVGWNDPSYGAMEGTLSRTMLKFVDQLASSDANYSTYDVPAEKEIGQLLRAFVEAWRANPKPFSNSLRKLLPLRS